MCVALVQAVLMSGQPSFWERGHGRDSNQDRGWGFGGGKSRVRVHIEQFRNALRLFLRVCV